MSQRPLASRASSAPSPAELVAIALGCSAIGLGVRLSRFGIGPLVTEHLVGYSTHGFVRRGLVGTLAGPWLETHADIVVSMVTLSLLGGATLCLLLIRLCDRLHDPAQAWFVVAATATIYSQLGWDYGRVDVLVLTMLTALWIAVDRGTRPHLLAAILVAGGLAHEMALLWGGALLTGAAVAGKTAWRELRLPAITAFGLGAALLLTGGYEGSPSAFVAAMPVEPPAGSGGGVGRAAPWTAGTATGFASVREWASAAGPVDLGILPVVTVVSVAALRRSLGLTVAVVTVSPAVLLALVGVDHSRWAFLLAFVTMLQLAHVHAVPRLDEVRARATASVLAIVGAWGHIVAIPYWVRF